MTPRITVIWPTYNRSAAILPTIGSVLGQTVADWELLVVSDASSDDTDDIVRRVGDDRVRLLRVARHGSPGGPRNAGLAAARTPYVATSTTTTGGPPSTSRCCSITLRRANRW